jgi:hypothetical protein
MLKQQPDQTVRTRLPVTADDWTFTRELSKTKEEQKEEKVHGNQDVQR